MIIGSRAVLKTVGPKGLQGSSPWPSANLLKGDRGLIGAKNRYMSFKKALRKRRLSQQIYFYMPSLNWSYYDNLHQYSKNKIVDHRWRGKTRNKGRRRYTPGNYYKAIDYCRSDLAKQLNMDSQIVDYLQYGLEYTECT